MSLWIETEQYRAVGAVLAAARRRAGLTQQELAKQLGKPQSFVSEYERGQRRVDVIEFVVISNTLGIRAVDLFSDFANAIKQ
jgi:transcriptional regulator with XRE-family HTH domain